MRSQGTDEREPDPHPQHVRVPVGARGQAGRAAAGRFPDPCIRVDVLRAARVGGRGLGRPRQPGAQGLHLGQHAVPVHRPAGDGGGHLGRDQSDQRDGRPAAVLRLRGIARPGDRPDRLLLHRGVGRHGLRQRLGHVRSGGHLRRRHQALTGRPRRDPVHGPDRLARRVPLEHLPAERRALLGHLADRHRDLHRADRV